ncbi:MAG: Na+/H+ antiporter [Candidatus Eremiobacterota bacterium]
MGNLEQFFESETLIIELLVLVTIVAVVAQRLRMPYTVALVIAGLFVTSQSPVNIEITPELILGIFIPPLVFEAAFHVEFNVLRDNFTPILMLAVPGVIITTLIVGAIITFGTGVSMSVAIVFGALISATDPVAVVALFRTLGVSKKLAVTVEGESLFNDGTAIVLFKLALAVALTASFNLPLSVLSFLKVSFMGLLIGGVLGWIASQIIARIDDYLIEITITTVLAYGSYLMAENFHVSGVLAVVAAGISSGNLGPSGMSPTTKIVLYNFWEYLAFLANSMVFLFIGLKINISTIVKDIDAILVAVIAVLISRAIVVYGLSWPVHHYLGGYMPRTWRHILFWGGLRGALSLALALTLPLNLPNRELLQTMAYGVVLFTLLAQGTTIQFILKKLGLTEKPERRLTREKKWGKLYSTRAGIQSLIRLKEEGILSGDIWLGMSEEYDEIDEKLTKDLTDLFAEYPDMEKEILIQARREALTSEKSALGDALHRGLLSDEVYTELKEEIDRRLEALSVIESWE